MNRPQQAIERGMDLFRRLVSADPALEAEFQLSRLEFHGPSPGIAPGITPGPGADLAARRHLEWFVLERPSACLEGVPVEVLQPEWYEAAGEAERDLAGAFLHSLAGAFEVTSSQPGRGVWVADLFAVGEHPVEEPEAAPELQPGDLLVGRLFPIGDGIHRLSPAMLCLRNPSLLEAVRVDLQAMREGRRGVLRIQQLELESLFFAGPALAAPPPGEVSVETPAAVLARIRAELVQAGITPEDAAALLEAMRTAPRTPGLVTEVMNHIAFETNVDLERTRTALAELWALPAEPAATEPEATEPEATEPAATEPVGDARAALAEFDAGRAAGRDLEQLFAELASNLGVEVPSEDEEQDPTLTEFPGVVGAMVEEFLWDVGREKGEPTAARYAALRRLSEYGKELSVFENVGLRELVDFAGRWLLDEGKVQTTEEARALFDALEEFCRWSKEQHDHDLWTLADASLERLRRDVPRHLLLRERIQPGDEVVAPYRVLAVNGEQCHLAATEGGDCQAVIPEEFRDLLQPGDVLHARIDDQGILHPRRAYPAELEQLLERDRT